MHASDNLILITLLVKLGVAAAVASSLARSTRFKRLLLRGAERTRSETMLLVAWICVPLTLGVLVRVRVPNFLAADLSFEGTTLLALVFGPAAAFVGANCAGSAGDTASRIFCFSRQPVRGGDLQHLQRVRG